MPTRTPARSSREIYKDILSYGLLAIRSTKDLAYAQALADHLHNVPDLLLHLEHAGLHDYYWRVERTSFVRQFTTEQARIFEGLWQGLEAARKAETEIL